MYNIENIEYSIKRKNEIYQKNNKLDLARPFTVHSYFTKPQGAVQNDSALNVEQKESLSIRNRFNNNLNRFWLKTKNFTCTNSKWFIMVLFFVMFAFIIMLVIITTSKNSNGTCLTSECVESASRSLKLLENKFDPCVDFYSFACGKFLKDPMLPDREHVRNGFLMLTDILEKQLFEIIKEPEISEPELRFPVKKIFVDCITYKNTSDKEIENVKMVLNSLGDWPMIVGNKWNEKNFDLLKLMVRLTKIGIPCNLFFKFGVNVNLIQTQICGLTLTFHKPKILDLNTYQIISKIIVKLGANMTVVTADLRAYEEIVKLLDKNLDVSSGEGYVTLQGLSKSTRIDWILYVRSLFDGQNITINRDELIYVSTNNLNTVLELISNVSKRTQANYVLFEIIHWMYKYLPSLHYKLEQKMPKSSECVSIVAKSLPLLINSLYARRYFNIETKTKLEKLVMDIRKEFLKILNTVEWLDNHTRISAVEKLNSMKVCVGYPEELLDDKVLKKYYHSLKINYTTYLSAIMSTEVFEFNNQLRRLRQPVKNCYWVDTSHRVTIINAEYYVVNNGIRLPAAFFQDLVFDKDRPNYINYATAGMIIGHEMTHGFDNKGKKFDKDGSLKNWWSNTTNLTFKKKAECIINQYTEYKVSELNTNVNGLLTLGENIADNGGLKQSFLAYTNWVKENGPERLLPGLNYTSTQMFWIAFAQFWCSRETIEYQQRKLLDVHAPARFRVIGTLSNIEHFSTDFKCPIGSPMNPKTKCNIW